MYQNTDEQEGNSPATKYETHNASLNHVLYFGAGSLDALSSSASATDQIGALAFTEYRLDENLRVQHSPDFQTHYDYTLQESSISGISQTSNAVDAGFIHHLFQSLTTTGDFNASLLQASGDSEVEQAAATLGWDYSKLVAFGTFMANLSLGWTWQYSPQGTGTIPVINQPETFQNSQPITLTQPNINPASIQVLSATGVPYLKANNYAVNSVGNLIQIQRIVGGLIPPDSSVLLDYDLNPQPAYTSNTGDLNAGTRYQINEGFLSGLAPYVRYGLQSETIDTDAPDQFTPDSYNDLVAGVDYRIGRFTFNAEQQWHDSTLVPFDATRFSARYDQRLDRDSRASFSGNYSTTNYYSEHDYVTDASLDALAEHQLGEDWSIRAEALYLNDRDQLFGNTEGLEEQLEMRWKHNQFEAYARLRNATLNTSGDDTTTQTVEVGLTRRF
jgi:hypothetical protein